MDDLVNRARSTIPEWSRAKDSDFAMMLIQLWAYVADVQNYYLDRAYTEAFIATATQRSSVQALAQSMGYTPNPRVSATATVTVANSTTVAVTIPKGTMFFVPYTATTGNIYFTSSADQSVAVNGGTTAVFVDEGRNVTETLTTNFNGRPSVPFTLSEQKVIPSSLELTVGTDTYTYLARMPDAPATAKKFTTLTDSSDRTMVLLGNGVNGFIPPSGATITATYRVGQGSLGNVAVNAITKMDDAGALVGGGVGITVSSSTVGSGGGDPESLSSIKTSAPTLKSTQDRAVTAEDYKSVMKGFEGVSKAHVVTTASSGVVTVNYSALPTYEDYDLRGWPLDDEGFNLSSNLSLTSDFGTAGIAIDTGLAAHLADRSMIGVVVNQISTTINTVDVHVAFSRVEYLSGFSESEISKNVKDAIRALFTWDNIKFDQTIRHADIAKAAQEAEGVVSVTVSNIKDATSSPSTADFAITPSTASAVSLPSLRSVTVSGLEVSAS
jgi:hypothetical protein